VDRRGDGFDLDHRRFFDRGPDGGRALDDAFVVFWFAWRHFQPAGDTFIQ
jgi:hypothetical protein